MTWWNDLFKSHPHRPQVSESVPAVIPAVTPLEPSCWLDPIAQQAIITAPITPHRLGRVKYRGSLWRAWSNRPAPLEVGSTVRVMGRRGTILVVEPCQATIPLAM